MAFSYTAIIYSEIKDNVYLHANSLVNDNKVEILKSYNNGCRAVVHSTSDFPVVIGFAKIGTPNYSCTCVAYSYDYVCEHITSAALAYDLSRGVKFIPYPKS